MLKRRAIGAVLWSAADGFTRQGLLFVVSIVLARILGPRDFGLIALVAMFTGIGAALLDGGFSAALIQRQDADRVDESTVFWFNAAIGTVVALAIWALGPAVAAFYRQPVLAPLMSLMAINVFVASLGAIHATLLAKELGFRQIMKVGTAANVVAGAVAIAMAWRGYGVWSLACQAIATSAVSTALYWYVHRWRPLPVFSTASARKLFGFGGYHFASTMIDIIYSRLYTLLLGRFYSVRELGLYNNADNTKQMPCGFFTGILMRAAFPMFSAAANDQPVLGRGVQVAVRCTMLLNVPVMIGMATVAEPLVLVLFGRDWLPMVPVLRVLCLVGVLWPLQVINIQALMAQGHSRLMFHVELLKKAIGLALLLAGAWFGMMGIAWSQVLASLVAFSINARYAHRLLGYGAFAQARDIGPTVAVAFLMGGAVSWLGARVALPPAAELAVLAAFGAGVFLLLCWMLRLASMAEMVAVIRHGRLVPAGHGGGSS
jgi:teichuronic acid exporter